MKEDKKKNRYRKKNNKVIIIFRIIFLITFILSITYLLHYAYKSYQNKNLYNDLYKDLTGEIVNQEGKNIFVEKVKELQKENSDIVGWIRIDDTVINYPVLQTTNNDYYLTHDYKKEYNKYGSIFIDKNINITDVNSNIIIYGHSMKDGQMFGTLKEYTSKEFYESHPIINIATAEEESEYEIICVFKSLSFREEETDVFRYYSWYSFYSEQDYEDYLQNCIRLQLYSTGKTAEYGEQLITLITCEYSQENGRIVVVAKKIN